MRNLSGKWRRLANTVIIGKIQLFSFSH